MLESGANPDLGESTQGKTPIYDAIGLGLDRVKLLVDAGADIDVVSENGDTPVMEAVSLIKFDVALFLLDRGADYDIQNKHGYSVFDRVNKKLQLLDKKHRKYLEAQKLADYLRKRNAVGVNL